MTNHLISPVIIIGMHRSGTTMLSEVLEKGGLFQGWKKEQNNESRFFIKLNDWILRELGGRWDAPESVIDIESHTKRHVDAIELYIRDQLKSPRSLEYLGVTEFLKFRSIFGIQNAWCWKDPRTTLLLPLWLRIFPKAKIIHIVRHGVDVANSLAVRTNKYLEKNKRAYSRRRWMYSLMGKRGVFIDSPRCLSLEGGFSLWQSYVEAAKKSKDFQSGGFMEVKYEDLLDNPKEIVTDIFNFCELDVNKLSSSYLSHFIDRSKGEKYKQSNDLIEFAEKVSEQLKKYGY